jgi:Vacuole effluxer Atg22 like
MSRSAPSRWVVAMGIYIIGNVSYRLTGAFYSAIFPRLARNTTHSRELRKKYDQNEISKDVYEKGEALEKSKISSLSIVGILTRVTSCQPFRMMTCVDRPLPPSVALQCCCYPLLSWFFLKGKPELTTTSSYCKFLRYRI